MPTVLLAFFVAACSTPSFETDSGQLAISDEEVIDLVADDGGPSPFLEGTGLCPTVACTADGCPEDEDDVLACYTQSFAGAVTVGDCLTFDEPGVVDWTFTPQSCPANEAGYLPAADHVAIDVLAEDAVEGRLAMPLEESVEAEEGSADVRVLRPDDWRFADGDTWQLAAEEPFLLSPRLRTLADGAPVAWRDGLMHGGVGVDVTNGDSAGTARVVLNKGQTADLTLDVGGHSVPVGEATGVPVSSIKSLEIAVVYLEQPGGLSFPYYARAVARDADGKLVLGAPIHWKLHGLLVTPGPDGGLPGADYVALTDQCADPGTTFGEQRARLTASVGLVSTSTELVWNPRPEAAPTEGWVAADACQGPCGCSTGGEGSLGGGALLVAALLLRRRSPAA
jgi:MYXO-CTERM domain-containing protein